MCPKQSKIYQEGEVVGNFNITYLRETQSRKYGKSMLRYAMFECYCGNIFETHISAVNGGHTSSCGCVKLKIFLKHTRTHGMCTTHTYHVWDGIRQRTGNKNFRQHEDYGARGITMFPPWIHDFQLFYDYVSALPNFEKENYTIDRINNNGNYEPGNLRWTTRHVQGANQRKQRDNTSGYTGVVKSRKKWCSHIVITGKSIHLGMFLTPIDGVIARNNYIIANSLFEYPIQPIKT